MKCEICGDVACEEVTLDRKILCYSCLNKAIEGLKEPAKYEGTRVEKDRKVGSEVSGNKVGAPVGQKVGV